MNSADYQEFTLNWDDDFGKINFNLTEQNGSEILIDLTLAPLWDVDQEEERGKVYDIPRNLFEEGDYYQSSTRRHTQDARFSGRSLLSLMHEIIRLNAETFPGIKNIYSTSGNNYQEEDFFTADRNRFWEKQMEKSAEIPVSFEALDNRYRLRISR